MRLTDELLITADTAKAQHVVKTLHDKHVDDGRSQHLQQQPKRKHRPATAGKTLVYSLCKS